MKKFAVNIALDACQGDGRWEWIYIFSIWSNFYYYWFIHLYLILFSLYNSIAGGSGLMFFTLSYVLYAAC